MEKRLKFDVVVGNPPYIDSEGMVNAGMEDFRTYISKNFIMTKGNWDIYIAFFEIGFKLLNKNGSLIYITPDKWIAKPFGNELRKQLLYNIRKILIAGRKIFETAKVDSVITLITKKESSLINILEFDKNKIINKNEIKKELIKAPFALDFLFSNYMKLILKIDKNENKIYDFAKCENACATSDAYKLKEIIFSLEKKEDYDKLIHNKVINTGTISKYNTKWGDRDMTYLKDKYLFPVVEKNQFFNLFNNSYSKKAIKPKLILKGLTLLDACIDLEGDIIPGKSTLIIIDEEIKKLKLIMAIINSKLSIFYIKEKYSASSYNGGINFTKDMINEIPIPKISLQQQKPFIDLVDEILIKKEQNLDTTDLENKIDIMVYKLYELTYDEVFIVDPGFKIGREEYYGKKIEV